MKRLASAPMATDMNEDRPSKDTQAEFDRLVLRIFPSAKKGFQWGMSGWRIERKISRKILMPTKGTMDPRYAYVAWVARKSGLTLNIVNPADYYFLEGRKAKLEEAGFKVMRACLQFNRKKPFPLNAVQGLLVDLKKSLR